MHGMESHAQDDEGFVERPFEPEDMARMIEDATFVRDLLIVFADEPDWPSKLTVGDLQRLFPERSGAETVFHLKCCQEAGLLDAAITRVATMKRVSYNVGHIDGLTHKGSEFVLGARQSALWRKAVDKCMAEAGHVGLSRLTDALLSVVL